MVGLQGSALRRAAARGYPATHGHVLPESVMPSKLLPGGVICILLIASQALYAAEQALPKSIAAGSIDTGPIDPKRLSDVVRTLAGADFEGRAPGSRGEAKTV